MKKKVLIAAVAATLGFSINVSANSAQNNSCDDLCREAFRSCHIYINVAQCSILKKLCHKCLAG